MLKNVFLFLLLLAAAGCNSSQNKNPQLQQGNWRAVLQRADGIAVPFNFEVKDSGQVLYIRNGKGRLRVDSIRYLGDSVYIHMPFFNSDFITQIQKDGSLKGKWVKHYPDTNRMLDFTARPGVNYRLIQNPASPDIDISGRWRTSFFTKGEKDSTMAVGEFQQKGNLLTGTFLTEYGDYRYLQGVVDGDSLQLSTFDGSHIFLFQARIATDQKIKDGVFYSGFEGKKNWQAQKDRSAKLPNPFGITTYKPGKNRLHFTFPDLKGDSLSIDDPFFNNKVVIVQILGSWCPNCMDETQFLSQWYKKNKNRRVAVIGLCYERSPHFDQAVKSVLTFKNRFDVEYPLLITGITANDPRLMEKTLPQLEHFISFPTTIFINKKGEIAKIHAGFSGPGTGIHFKQYKQEFNHIIDSLLKE